MRATRGVVVFFVVLSAAIVAPLTGQTQRVHPTGAVLVRVSDAAGSALPGTEVGLPTLDVTFSVPSGGLLLVKDVAPGVYVVRARRLGFAAQNRIVRVKADTVRLDFVMSRVTTLDTVNIEATPTGWMSDFAHNRKMGLGQFFTVSDIRQSGAVEISQFLRRARGISVVGAPSNAAGIPQPDVVASRRCGAVSVYLDGQPVTPAKGIDGIVYGGRDSPGNALVGASEGEFDINLVPLSIIGAIEVYTDLASIPAEYRSASERCGAIFMWTT